MIDNNQGKIISSEGQKPPIIAWVALAAIFGIIFYISNSVQIDKTIEDTSTEQVISEPVTGISEDMSTEQIVLEPIIGISEDTKKAISEYFISDKEPTIKDATWTDQSKNMLYIGVIDDKTNRDGLAEYTCTVLTTDFGLTGQNVDVYVMDIAKIAKGGKWVVLGKAKCE